MDETYCDIKRRKRVLFAEAGFEFILHFDPTHIVYTEEEPSTGDKDHDIYNEVMPMYHGIKETEMITFSSMGDDEIVSPSASMDVSLVENQPHLREVSLT